MRSVLVIIVSSFSSATVVEREQEGTCCGQFPGPDVSSTSCIPSSPAQTLGTPVVCMLFCRIGLEPTGRLLYGDVLSSS
ncbi:hypothetical protein L210DRAFT_3584244 [Boletus edulis BED1]|uniref:Secreted protein n=1 Tax=Boletus edulis BED1 TaxID=1328754 RepID=A0AAD4BAK8_BOLED|nr:hypothetical protein L210DRAFT_3584244 [Boletus edulis BED1]